MAGFSSMDDLINQVTTNGQTWKSIWNKNFLPTTAAALGEWFCMARGGGNPPADSLYNTGSNLTFQPAYDTTATASGIPHGGNVFPYYKEILNASAYSASITTAPAVMMLVDLVGFYRVTTVTSSGDQATTNTISTVTNAVTDYTSPTLTHTFNQLMPYTRIQLTTAGSLPTGLNTTTDYYVIKVTDTTCRLASSYANAVAGTNLTWTGGSGVMTINTVLPRYTNGAGLQAFAWNTNATAMGAATPSLRITYTNSKQTASQITPAVLPACKTAAANGLIPYSGTGAGKYGPFMPLAQGDAGIAKIDQINLSISYASGEFSVGLCRPLITMPIVAQGVASERDFVNQLPSLPRIYDGANLQWLIYNGALTPTNSAFFGHLDLAWN